MDTLGRHVIIEFCGCDRHALNALKQVRDTMLAAARHIGATVIGDNFHPFSPQGLSGTVVIAESHLSIHTWPERGYAAVDIYTCGGLNPRKARGLIGKQLQATTCRVQEIRRGLPEDLRQDTTFSPEDIVIDDNIEATMLLTASGDNPPSTHQELSHGT